MPIRYRFVYKWRRSVVASSLHIYIYIIYIYTYIYIRCFRRGSDARMVIDSKVLWYSPDFIIKLYKAKTGRSTD